METAIKPFKLTEYQEELLAILLREEGPEAMSHSLEELMHGWVSSPLVETEGTGEMRSDMYSSYRAMQKLLLLLRTPSPFTA